MEPEAIVITFCAYAIAFCWHNHFSECGEEKKNMNIQKHMQLGKKEKEQKR